MTISNSRWPEPFKLEISMRGHLEMNSAWFKPAYKAGQI